MLLSAWASSATTASKGVPDTQAKDDQEAVADIFPICQPEGARLLGGLDHRELATSPKVRETFMMEGAFALRQMASQ